MPDLSLSRNDFVSHLRGKSVDVRRAQADERLDGVDVARADLDGDGAVAGTSEAERLFAEIDRFDRDGNARTVRVANDDGANEVIAEKLAAVGDIGDVAALRALANTGAGRVSGRTPARGPGAAEVVRAANDLVENSPDAYGADKPWVNNDPHHNSPVGRPLRGLAGKWKCNLFGGNVMHAAGFEPPYYGNNGRGEYPNANQMYKWSDRYAGRFGNKVHFAMRGELDVASIPAGPDRDRAVASLLARARPGDLLIVDHMGGDVADGGHVRVVVGNGMSADGTGTLQAAQASFTRAETQHESVGDFTGEERIWILTPNRPRR